MLVRRGADINAVNKQLSNTASSDEIRHQLLVCVSLPLSLSFSLFLSLSLSLSLALSLSIAGGGDLSTVLLPKDIWMLWNSWSS